MNFGWEVETMNKLSVWLKASRLPSQSYIFFPLLLGQAIAYFQTGLFSWRLFVLIHLFGLFIQLYIVYANDYADKDVDESNETYNLFSGGSRVLVEGQINDKDMKFAIFLMIGLNLLLGGILTFLFQRLLSLPLIIFSLLLLWAYSYWPFKLSYRGGGEFLQMIGVAGVLPVFAYYIQLGSLDVFPWFILLILFPNHLACALSTALPDQPSDKENNKRTIPVIFNLKLAKYLIVVLNFLSVIFLVIFNIVAFNISIIIFIFIVTINLLLLYFSQNSPPGSKRLFKFVALNILSLNIFMIALSVYFFTM